MNVCCKSKLLESYRVIIGIPIGCCLPPPRIGESLGTISGKKHIINILGYVMLTFKVA